jgi:voltage-gated potassium channel
MSDLEPPSSNLRKRLFEILEPAPEKDLSSKVLDIGLLVLILLNVIAVILETIPGWRKEYGTYCDAFETFSLAVFSIEYFLRLWTCVESEEYSHPTKGRIKFAISPLALIDLLAILPFILHFIFPVDLRVVRILRFVRIFRVFKLYRYSKTLQILGKVFGQKKEDLLITLVFGFFFLIIASSLMFLLEREAQPKAFSSIPAAMWWGVATLTTVGYGDIYPVTPFGKALGSIIAIVGIGMFALPAGILASGFSEAMESRKDTATVCPHCGKDIDH